MLSSSGEMYKNAVTMYYKVASSEPGIETTETQGPEWTEHGSRVLRIGARSGEARFSGIHGRRVLLNASGSQKWLGTGVRLNRAQF